MLYILFDECVRNLIEKGLDFFFICLSVCLRQSFFFSQEKKTASIFFFFNNKLKILGLLQVTQAWSCDTLLFLNF